MELRSCCVLWEYAASRIARASIIADHFDVTHHHPIMQTEPADSCCCAFAFYKNCILGSDDDGVLATNHRTMQFHDYTSERMKKKANANANNNIFYFVKWPTILKIANCFASADDMIRPNSKESKQCDLCIDFNTVKSKLPVGI